MLKSQGTDQPLYSRKVRFLNYIDGWLRCDLINSVQLRGIELTVAVAAESMHKKVARTGRFTGENLFAPRSMLKCQLMQMKRHPYCTYSLAYGHWKYTWTGVITRYGLTTVLLEVGRRTSEP